MSIAGIIRDQIQNGKTVTGFAKELKLSHSTLSLILKGDRQAGGKVIRALLRHPDTREAILISLSKNVTPVNIKGNEDEHGDDRS